MESLTNLQSIIDENKEKFSNHDYLQCCNEMKCLFDQKYQFYEIEYGLYEISQSDDNKLDIEFQMNTQILKLLDGQYESIKELINENSNFILKCDIDSCDTTKFLYNQLDTLSKRIFINGEEFFTGKSLHIVSIVKI